MKNIFITRKIPDVGIKMLEEKGYSVTIGKSKTPLTQKEIIKEIKGKNYDAVVTLLTDKIDSLVFDATPLTKLFANYAVGYDNIDLVEASKRGITVSNTPGDYMDGIAQFTVALLLALMSRLIEADTFVRKGKYKGFDPMLFMGDKLKGKTVAIIGTGRIGEQVAYKLYKGFDVKIIYYDVARNERIEKDCNAQFMASVDEALSVADVVSIHVPLLPSTHHLINGESFKKMKPSAYLINTSRGPVLDENALVDALKNGKIRGAGLDVYEFEPKLAKGLAKLPNTVLTPHIASAQTEARDEMSRIVAENIIDFFEGREPRNKVNK
jgi:glyoxylate reductase